MLEYADKNYIDNLVTLSEAVNLTRKHPDEILRMGASGDIQCYFPITVEKIEVGTLDVAPTKANPDSVKYEERPDWSAIPVSPYLEEILEGRPEYFSVISEVFPQGMILMLESYQVAGLLTQPTVFVKYGILPDGYYFKVVSTLRGLEIGKDNILLLKISVDSLKCIEKNELVEEGEIWGLRPIEIPKGTLWSEINFHIKEYSEFGGKFDFRVAGKLYQRTFKTMGLADNRSGRPAKGWVLLFLLLYFNGDLTKKKITNIFKKISILNKALVKLFPGVEGNPFGPYRKKEGWKPNMMVTIPEEIRRRMRANN